MSLYGLESGEFYDEPLAVRVYGKRLDNTNKVENDDLFTIGRVVNAGRDKKIAFSERRFVRGVALWTGGEKDTKERKMKGLKLFYATVSTAGVVDAEDKTGTAWSAPTARYGMRPASAAPRRWRVRRSSTATRGATSTRASSSSA